MFARSSKPVASFMTPTATPIRFVVTSTSVTSSPPSTPLNPLERTTSNLGTKAILGISVAASFLHNPMRKPLKDR